MNRPSALVIDTHPGSLEAISRAGRRAGFDVSGGARMTGLDLLAERRIDLVFVDPHAQAGGFDILSRIRDQAPGCGIVVLSSAGAPLAADAADAIERGAMDVLPRPLDPAMLDRVFEALARARDERRAVCEARAALARRLACKGMVGPGTVMQELFARLRRLAPHARAVLITGATGTGKALSARALHDLGPRRHGRFVTVAAQEGRPMPAEAAYAGTLFVDDAADLSRAQQAALLRILDTGDAHILAATRRDLRAEVAGGRFDRALFRRIARVEVALPALSERAEDIPYLAATFMHAWAERAATAPQGMSIEAERLLQLAPWDGNVRELRNIVERACVLSDGGPITERELRLAHPRACDRERSISARRSIMDEPLPTLSRLERDHVLRALQHAMGNKKAAAALLGVSRRAFYRRLERLSLGDTIARRTEAARSAQEVGAGVAAGRPAAEIAHA